MDNVLIEINKKTRQVFLTNSVIGNDGENLQENLVFSFNDEFVDGTGRLELIKPDKTKSYIMLTKVDETYQVPVKSIITKGGRLTMQLVITQGTDPNAIPIFKSNKFYVVVNSSINFLIEEPDEYPQWIDVANTKLNEIDAAILEASNLDIDANKEDNVTTITLTDKDGQTKEVQILDGERGPQGIRGETGPAGADGKDATINGVNTINIEAGDNITLEQEDDTLIINSTGGGTSDYDNLSNKPSINNVELSGNKSLSDLGIQSAGNYYTKPSTGIPSTDLSSAVQTSLGKADTAIQSSDLSTVATSGSYNDLSNKPTIPTNSDFTLNGLSEKSYNNLTDKPTIPDVSNFITKDVDDLTNYYKKSETYTQTEINNKLSAVYKYKGTVATYQDLPSTDLTIGDVYNIETADSTHGIKAGDNVAWNGTTWDVLAGTIDLSNYVTNTDYATSEIAGVVKISSNFATGMSNGNIYASTKTYSQYPSMYDNAFISKATLENVIIGKGLVSNTDYASASTGGVVKTKNGFAVNNEGSVLCSTYSYSDYVSGADWIFVGKGTLENVLNARIGDIDTALDLLNGEVI